MKPYVSICIPVFKTEELLEEALQSVAEQTFKNFEIVVVNDGSTNTNSEGFSCKKSPSAFG